jgi:hypothetical protein
MKYVEMCSKGLNILVEKTAFNKFIASLLTPKPWFIINRILPSTYSIIKW